MNKALIPLLAAVALATAMAETNAVLTPGGDSSRVELIVTLSNEGAESNLVVCASVRNVSRELLSRTDVASIIGEYQLTWDTPLKLYNVPLGLWRGPVPDLKPAETCVMQYRPSLDNAKWFPSEDEGIYFLSGRIGANKSNTICFLFRGGKLEKLPMGYSEREIGQDSKTENILQNQPSDRTR